jgi:hypothetical protein
MLVDKQRERVAAVVLDSGLQILVEEISLRNGRVVTAHSDVPVVSGMSAISPR